MLIYCVDSCTLSSLFRIDVAVFANLYFLFANLYFLCWPGEQRGFQEVQGECALQEERGHARGSLHVESPLIHIFIPNHKIPVRKLLDTQTSRHY